MKVNEYAKQQKQFQFDMGKIAQQHINAKELAAIKKKDDLDLAAAKGELVSQNPLLNILTGGGAEAGGAANADFPVDKYGKPDPNVDVVDHLTDQYVLPRTAARDLELDAATSILTFLKPVGDKDLSGNATQKYTIKVAGTNYTGSIDQIKKKLGTKTEKGGYLYWEDIDALYQEQSKILNDPKQMGSKYPGLANSKMYNDLYEKIYSPKGINTTIEVLDRTYETVINKYKNIHDQSVVLVQGEDANVKASMQEGGMPGIYKTLPSGLHRQLTKPEYIANVVELIKQGKVKNIDLIGWDTGTSSSNYMHTVKKGTGQYYTTRDGEGGSITKERQTTVTELDMAAIEAEAGHVYDKIKIKTNAAATGRLGDKYDTGTFKGTLAGRSGATDMFISPVYKAPIDPLSNTSEGQTTLAQMITQKKMLDAQGGGYTMVLGNLSDKKDKASIATDALATKAYNAYIADMTTWLGNPKRSNTAGIAPRANIIYSGTLGAAGEGNKTTAGYTIDGFNEWLSSKVKGSATEATGAAGEYGLFSKPEVDALRSGISMVFDKKQDINPRAERNQYYSNVLSAVEASPDKFAEYTYPGIDGMTPTATYRIVKTGTDQFYATYKYNTYQPNGTYLESDWKQVPIQTGNFNVAQAVDAQVEKLQLEFEQIKKASTEDYNRNSAVKGRKN